MIYMADNPGVSAQYVLHCQCHVMEFEGDTLEHLRQLLVNPEMVAKEIKKRKEIISSGVDSIYLRKH